MLQPETDLALSQHITFIYINTHSQLVILKIASLSVPGSHLSPLLRVSVRPITYFYALCSAIRKFTRNPRLLQISPFPGLLRCLHEQSRLLALIPSQTFCICLFATWQDLTFNYESPLPWVIFDSCSQKPSMAPNCLLNHMKSPIQMIIFTPKCLHLHSTCSFSKQLLSNLFVSGCKLGPMGNYKI